MTHGFRWLGLAFAFLLGLPGIAQAQGLGEIRVGSKLGQPLRAEVAVTSAHSGREAGFHASVGKPDDYKVLDLEFDPYLYSIRVTPEVRGKDTVLVLASPRPVQEPFMELVVVLQSAAGRVTRRYTLLFDSR